MIGFTTIDKASIAESKDIWGVFKDSGLPIIEIEGYTKPLQMFDPRHTIEVTDQGDRFFYEW